VRDRSRRPEPGNVLKCGLGLYSSSAANPAPAAEHPLPPRPKTTVVRALSCPDAFPTINVSLRAQSRRLFRSLATCSRYTRPMISPPTCSGFAWQSLATSTLSLLSVSLSRPSEMLRRSSGAVRPLERTDDVACGRLQICEVLSGEILNRERRLDPEKVY
jgi:hypothetical protein